MPALRHRQVRGMLCACGASVRAGARGSMQPLSFPRGPLWLLLALAALGCGSAIAHCLCSLGGKVPRHRSAMVGSSGKDQMTAVTLAAIDSRTTRSRCRHSFIDLSDSAACLAYTAQCF
ncbi:hypothetical protein [Xanthomonas arboricola]|uniref:hypothetical protein n=1 Tax=Xanthomonas arboricola TaxID=56448 RepID=UPI0009B7C3F8|nr:hypothetical protein [Xanthomonas arboricola]MDN0206998.1 hypothetical protein [Xanthomonas arboricola pv. corylina]MDN0211743.1 hypothetical protein [Xanthomonas arboricola pv. corylina]UQQ15681.1 hypothetical protein KPG65_04195 [Xanthomonas arboricola pv. corylina]WIX27063.1 hypothetical protein PUV44_11685 [Xanthomonas arboricola pv. corylina]